MSEQSELIPFKYNIIIPISEAGSVETVIVQSWRLSWKGEVDSWQTPFSTTQDDVI